MSATEADCWVKWRETVLTYGVQDAAYMTVPDGDYRQIQPRTVTVRLVNGKVEGVVVSGQLVGARGGATKRPVSFSLPIETAADLDVPEIPGWLKKAMLDVFAAETGQENENG